MIVAGLATALALAFSACGQTPLASIPGVAPAPDPSTAIAAVESAGLRVEIPSVPGIRHADRGVNGYSVLRQSPSADTRVPRGSVVLLTLSLSVNGGPGGLGGAARATVPRLTGLDPNHALRAAADAGLYVTILPLRVPTDHLVIARQSIPAGRTVPHGMTVVLALSVS